MHDSAVLFGHPCETRGELGRIHRVDQVRELERLPGFSALQVTDHVPGRRTASERTDFALQLLDPVFSQVRQPGPQRGLDRLEWVCLGHRDEAHRAPVAPRGMYRVRDAVAHTRQCLRQARAISRGHRGIVGRHEWVT